MTKTEIIEKTLKGMGLFSLHTESPYSEEQDEEEFIVLVLQDVLPIDVNIKTCDDFKSLERRAARPRFIRTRAGALPYRCG